MAKAAPINENIDPNDAQAWLAEVLRVRFEEVLKFRDAALDPSDTEGVHDMRVAIRRLRSVLRDFAGVADQRRVVGLTRSLKKLADMLGSVRDIDVLIEELKDLSDKAKDTVRDGLDEIIVAYHERRIAAHLALETFLTDEFVLDLRRRFSASIESAARQRRLSAPCDAREEGSAAIKKCLEEFLDLSEVIYHPFSTKRIHKLRIAGKRLRYAIELFAPHFGESLEPFVDDMKEMQKHLGDIHDCDVWIREVRTHIPPKRLDPDDPKPTAAVWLISRFAHRRTKAYRSALELWSDWESSGFCEELRGIVSTK